MNVCLSEYGAGFANRDRQSHRMFLFGEAGVEGWVGKLRIPPLRGSVKVHCILHFVLRLAGCCEVCMHSIAHAFTQLAPSV